MNTIYTAVTDTYDILQQPPERTKARFVAFVTNPAACFTGKWEMRPLVPFCHDNTRNSRRYKILAHESIPDAEYSMWMDGSVTIQEGFNLDAVIDEYLGCHNLALFGHRCRRCLYDEARTCSSLGLDEPSLIAEQMSRYEAEGYPPDRGLAETSVILRRNCPSITELNNRWWEEICKGSRRDQLSFDYVTWKLNVSYSLLPGTIRENQFFLRSKHPHRRIPLAATSP